MYSKTIFTKGLFLLSMFFSLQIQAQDVDFIKPLFRSDVPNPYSELVGTQVEIDGNYAVVSSVSGGLDGVQTGLVYVYEYDTNTSLWSELKILSPSVPKEEGRYGWNISIDGDVIVVGQTGLPNFGPNQFNFLGGDVFIYHKDEGGVNNWGEVKHLTSPDPQALDLFGYTVEVSDDVLMVGQLVDESVFVFERDQGGIDNWGLSSSIVVAGSENFVDDIDVEGDLAIIASSQGDVARIYGRDQGGLNNWGELAAIDIDGASLSPGPRVAISSDIALVGIDIDGINKVLVLSKDEGGTDNWGLVQEIIEIGEFGTSLSLNDSIAVIGARRSSINGNNSGQVFVYAVDATDSIPLQQLHIITPELPAIDDFFGGGVAIQGDQVVVGAAEFDFNLSGVTTTLSLPAGRVLFFDRNEGAIDNWGEVQAIEGTSSGPQELFADKMDTDGDYMIASASGDQVLDIKKAGSAYIYKRDQGGQDNWGEVKRLVAENPQSNQEFGQLVRIQGELAAIADSDAIHIFAKDEGGDDNWGFVKKIEQTATSIDLFEDMLVVGNNNKGFLFQKDFCGENNWGLVREFTAPVGSVAYGSSVSVYGDDILIGDRNSALFGNLAGAVHFYQKNTGGENNWGFVESFVGSESGRFGSRMSIFNDLLVVTSSNGSSGVARKLFVFEKEGGSYVEKKVIGNNTTAEFGNTIDHTDRYIITSIPERDNAAYVYERNTGGQDNWGILGTIHPPSTNDNEEFGHTLAISENSIFSRSRLGNAYSTNSGILRLFEIESVPFITEWSVSPNDNLIIPLPSGGFDFDYKWTLLSDPSIQIAGAHTDADGDFETNFVEGGTYSLEISGKFPHFTGYPAQKLLDVTQWGNNPWMSMRESFKDWQGSDFSAIDLPVLDRATDFTSIFEGASNFNGDISRWNVSNITSLSKAFHNAIAFDIDISSWTTPNVASLDSTLYGATSFNQNIGEWDTRSLTSMVATFKDATVFNQDISQWDVSNVTDLTSSFDNAIAFNQPVGLWDVSKSESFDRMFAGSVTMNQDLGAWQFSQTASATDVFDGATGFTCESWSPTIVGWHLNNLPIINFEIGGPNADYDSLAAELRLDLVARGWTINGTEVSSNCANLEGKFWTGLVDSDWNNAENWLPKSTPVQGESPIILRASNQPNIDITTEEMKTIRIDDDASIVVDTAGTLNINSNSSSLVHGIELAGGNSTITNNGTILIDSTTNAIYMIGFNTQLFNQGSIVIDRASKGIVFDDIKATFSNVDSILISNTVTGIEINARNSSVQNEGHIEIITGNIGVLLDANKCEFINEGELYIANCNRGIGFISSSPSERSTFTNNNFIDIQELLFGSFIGVTSGGNFRNNLCAVINIDNEFGDVKGSVINEGLINNFATVFDHTGTYSDIGFQYDPLGLIPNDNTIVLELPLTIALFNEDADGDGTTLCGGFPDDSNSVVVPPPPFKSIWNLPAGESIVIEHESGLNYDYSYCFTAVSDNTNITCGQGLSTDTNLSFTPSVAGTYELKITGDFPAMKTYNREQLIDITQWGSITWEEVDSMFFNWLGSDFSATDAPDLSQSSSMQSMFENATNFNSNINHWDVSSITNMSSTFKTCSAYNSPLGNWDVSNVTDMSEMFSSASNFAEDINTWNVSSVVDMSSMLLSNTAMNTSLGDWVFHPNIDMSSILALNEGFQCEAWSNTLIGWNENNPTIENQNVTTIGTSIDGPQFGIIAEEARDELIARGWTISNNPSNSVCIVSEDKFVTRWTMLPNDSIIIPLQGGESYSFSYKWKQVTNGINKIEGSHTNADGDLTLTSTASGEYQLEIEGQFPHFKDYTVSKINDVLQFGDIQWTSFESMFNGWQGVTEFSALDTPDLSQCTSMEGAFRSSNYKGDLDHWDVSTIKNMKELFASSDFNGNITSWDVSSVETMESMFFNAERFNQDITGWNTSSLINMTSTFHDAVSFDQEIGSWNVSNVKFMSFTFFNAEKFNASLASWNVSKVIRMDGMFAACDLFDSDISGWQVGEVTNMSGMFFGATIFNQDISAWNTSKVMRMSSMFRSTDFFNQDISIWDTGNVLRMDLMFAGATAFNQPIGSWNTEKVTNMDQMFFIASIFNQPIGEWNTGQVTKMELMFFNAVSFNQALGNWNTAKVTNMTGMFRDATAFNQPIESWDVSDVTNMKEMFSGAATFNQSLGNWEFSLNHDGDFTNFLTGTALDCEHWSSTIVGWNFNNPDINDFNIGADATLIFDAIASAARAELLARGWTIPGFLVSGSCLPFTDKFWTGEEDIEWEKATNWFPMEVPKAGDRVTIPSRVNQPTLSSITPLLKSVNTKSGSVLTIVSNAELKIE